MDIKELFCNWFEEKLPLIKAEYDWRIPAIDGFTPQHRTSYENTLQLKEFFRGLWNQARTEKEKIDVARLIIGEWGGIKTNNNSTLEWFVDEIQMEPPHKPGTPLNGVSSYSKLFSVVKPTEYAIYDARIAAGINSIQFNRDADNGVAFCFTSSSRNSIIKKYFSIKEFKPKSLHENLLWLKTLKDDTYRAYIHLLKSCLKEFPQNTLTDMEMALFHYSIDECQRAIAKVQEQA